MITQQVQIKINLPLALKDFVASKAAKFDMPVAGYIKHLILKDVEEMGYPVYEPSERTIKAYNKAIKNRKNAIVVKDVKKFFDSL